MTSHRLSRSRRDSIPYPLPPGPPASRATACAAAIPGTEPNGASADFPAEPPPPRSSGPPLVAQRPVGAAVGLVLPGPRNPLAPARRGALAVVRLLQPRGVR